MYSDKAYRSKIVEKFIGLSQGQSRTSAPQQTTLDAGGAFEPSWSSLEIGSPTFAETFDKSKEGSLPHAFLLHALLYALAFFQEITLVGSNQRNYIQYAHWKRLWQLGKNNM